MFLYITHGTYLFRKEVERMAANLAEEIKEVEARSRETVKEAKNEAA